MYIATLLRIGQYIYIYIQAAATLLRAHTNIQAVLHAPCIFADMAVRSRCGVTELFAAHAALCSGAHGNFPHGWPPPALATTHVVLSGWRKTVAAHIDRPLQRFSVHTRVHPSIDATFAANNAHLTCRNITIACIHIFGLCLNVSTRVPSAASVATLCCSTASCAQCCSSKCARLQTSFYPYPS